MNTEGNSQKEHLWLAWKEDLVKIILYIFLAILKYLCNPKYCVSVKLCSLECFIIFFSKLVELHLL